MADHSVINLQRINRRKKRNQIDQKSQHDRLLVSGPQGQQQFMQPSVSISVVALLGIRHAWTHLVLHFLLLFMRSRRAEKGP